MRANEIAELINTILEGVGKSELGAVLYTDEKGVLRARSISLQAFNIILSALCPKPVDGTLEVKEPKESWQGGKE